MKRPKSATGRVRLQKYLSDAGVSSRRRAEELIEAGRVLVNDEVVDRLPALIDPKTDRVIVDGARVRPQAAEYYLINKPKGVVCTNRDPSGRTRAVDLLPPNCARLFVVGRLDADSTGLLLMTNDGELAERLAHPRYGIAKVYQAEVRGQVPDDLPAQMKKGVHLAEGKAQASAVEIVHRSRQSSVLRITLREGRNRQIRRMLVRMGHKVRKLRRLQIGPLTMKGLPVGACRALTSREVAALRTAARGEPTEPTARTGRRRVRTDHARPTGRKATTSKTRKSTTNAAKQRAGAAPKPGTKSKPSPAPERPRRRLVT